MERIKREVLFIFIKTIERFSGMMSEKSGSTNSVSFAVDVIWYCSFS